MAHKRLPVTGVYDDITDELVGIAPPGGQLQPFNGLRQVSANVTVDSTNRYLYDSHTLVWTGNFTLTISAGLNNFGFIGEVPSGSTATIAFSGTTGNGAGTSLTRTNQAFCAYAVGTNAYRVT